MSRPTAVTHAGGDNHTAWITGNVLFPDSRARIFRLAGAGLPTVDRLLKSVG